MRKTGTVAMVALLLGGGMLVAPRGALPQDDTGSELVGTEHLAAIHLGTCREPAEDPAFVLGLVGPRQADDGAVADEADVRGQLLEPPLLAGGGTVDVALDALLDGGQPYALLVHATADDLTAPLACGEIGGIVADGQLPLPLRPLDDSGYAGVAILGADDTGGTAGTVLFFSDLAAYEGGGGGRGERAGGDRVRQGGQAGGGGGGGAAGGGRAGGGGGQSGIEVTGGVAPSGDGGAGEDDRTPRARRTRVAEDSTATVVPPTGGEATGTATSDATVEATVSATVAATEPTGAEETATAVVDPTASSPGDDLPTAVGELPTAVGDLPTAVPDASAPTAIPGEVLPTTVVEEPLPTAVPESVDPAADPAAETPAA